MRLMYQAIYIMAAIQITALQWMLGFVPRSNDCDCNQGRKRDKT